MPSPTSSLSTRRPELGTLLEWDLAASRDGFVGLQVFPQLDSAVDSGNFGRIPDEELIRDVETARAPRGAYNRDDYNFQPDSYVCREHGFEQLIDDSDARRFADYFDAMTVATERARDGVLRALEKRIKDAIDTAVTTDTAAGTVWSDSSSVPENNVRAAKIAVRNRTGLTPNVMLVDWEGWQHLVSHPQFRGVSGGQNFVDVRARSHAISAVAAWLDIDDIIIAGAGTMRNTANPGQGTTTLVSLWDRTKAILFVRRTDNDIQSPQLGRTITWTEDGGLGPGEMGVVETYRSEDNRSDVVRVRVHSAEKVLYAACAQNITGILA